MKTTYIMNIIRNSVKGAAVLFGAALVMAGCQRDGLADGVDSGDGQIRYSVSVAGGTKGALINTSGDDNQPLPVGSSFFVSAYKGSVALFENKKATSKDGGIWTNDDPQYWPLSTELAFFAYANTPASTVAMNAECTAQTLTYAVPEYALTHQDILLGYYYGDGGNKGIAEIRFGHPLTAVRFKQGNMTGVTIKSITLSGLISGGSVTMTSEGIGEWTVDEAEEYETEATLSGGDDPLGVGESSKLIGEDAEGNYNGAFLLVPQKLAESDGGHPVTVTVVLTTADGDVTVGADIASGSWKAGKTNTYTINFGGNTGFTLTITEWNSETYPVELEEEQSDLLTFIDLGLPSGTLWADRNIGAESVKDEPTCCGDYFAWSMTETYYDQASSNPPVDIVWKDAYSNGYAQYAWPAEKYNATDGLKKLELTDDVANVVLGNDARIPSVAQWNELIANCEITKTNNGGHGYVTLTSKLNGASIILPAAGFYSVKENSNYGNFGVYYMTSELYSDISQIYALWCGASENLQCKGGYSRFAGLPVRAVKPGPVKIGGVYWATKNVGAKTVAGSPSTSYGDYFAWGETEPYYSSISFNNASSATIGWKEDYKTKGYDWVNYKYCNGTDKTLTKYNTDAVCGDVDNKTVLESSDDAATANRGSSWRMPTYEDFQNLYKACTDKAENAAPESLPETITKGGVYWSDSYDGVAGILFVDKLDISKRVFFPAAGYFCGGTSFTAGGSIAAYWSSSLLDGSRNAHNMRFSTEAVNPSYPTGARQYGFPVRPVKDAD